MWNLSNLGMEYLHLDLQRHVSDQKLMLEIAMLKAYD